jgi:thiol-disulfide isomerase/thioredoxin
MPCKALAPAFDKIKEAYKHTEVRFEDVDVESDVNGSAETFKIRSVPTVVYLNGDTEIARLVGLNNKKDYVENIDKLLELETV